MSLTKNPMCVTTYSRLKQLLSTAGAISFDLFLVLGLTLTLGSPVVRASDGPLMSGSVTLPVATFNLSGNAGLDEQALVEFNHGHHDRAAQLWRVLAEDGDRDAQYALGSLYFSGDIQAGVDRNLETAATWYRRAARQGHIAAQYNLGILYASGMGVPHDMGQAAYWWRLAAIQGHTQAQFNLGLLYAQGSGVAVNPAEAVRWWGVAAEHGYAPAQFNLGLMYMMGDGVRESRIEAVRLWQLSAKQGFGQAIQVLATMKGTE